MIAGLLGPLLSSYKRWPIPVVVGEVLGGIIIGPAVLGWVSLEDPVVSALHRAGFALLMFTVALHLPLRDRTLRHGVRRATIATVATFIGGAIAGWLIAGILDVGRPWLWAILVANSSAALALPVLRADPTVALDEATGRLVVWIAMTDLVAVLFVPLVTAKGSILTVVLGSLLVTAAAWAAFYSLRWLGGTAWWRSVQIRSRLQGWGVDLRVALILLFGLTWIAIGSGTSALVAGFASGFAVASLGANDRLLTEIVGIGEGFFIPAFFVALGTSLRPHSVLDAKALSLVGLLVAGSLAAHFLGALLSRSGWRGTFVASAQLGVPAGIITIGTSEGWLSPPEASAIMAVSMISIGLCTIGAALASRPIHVRDRGTLTHLLRPLAG